MTEIIGYAVESFAPPIDEAKIAEYEKLANAIPDAETKDAMLSHIKMVKAWWKLPDSTREKVKHPTGIGHWQKLEEDHVKSLFDHVPWPRELLPIGLLFNKLPDGPTRNAANHLHWFAVSLAHDREPWTSDKLEK